MRLRLEEKISPGVTVLPATQKDVCASEYMQPIGQTGQQEHHPRSLQAPARPARSPDAKASTPALVSADGTAGYGVRLEVVSNNEVRRAEEELPPLLVAPAKEARHSQLRHTAAACSRSGAPPIGSRQLLVDIRASGCRV